MSLNKAQLAQDLLDMMKRGVDEKWGAEQSAQALADAVDRFVRTGSVNGVTVTGQNLTLTQSREVFVK